MFRMNAHTEMRTRFMVADRPRGSYDLYPRPNFGISSI